jgi:hypothetical protein
MVMSNEYEMETAKPRFNAQNRYLPGRTEENPEDSRQLGLDLKW